MKLQIIDDVDDAAFVAIDENEDLVGEMMYLVRPGYYDIYHTAVSEQYEGKGVAGAMVHDVLTLIREKNMKVFARCPYTANYIAKHPEFADILFD